MSFREKRRGSYRRFRCGFSVDSRPPLGYSIKNPTDQPAHGHSAEEQQGLDDTVRSSHCEDTGQGENAGPQSAAEGSEDIAAGVGPRELRWHANAEERRSAL